MTILHLEDSANDAFMIESLLQDEWPECQIRRVASGPEFESALEFEKFDLVLSDHHMPGYDGLRALEQTRRQRPDTPFVFISGTIGEERAIEAMRHGADDYVIKDRPARLVPAVRQALARKEAASVRLRMEDTLKQNQERFRQITENVSDMIAVLDVDGRRVYVNPAYRDVLGDPAKLLGTLAFDSVHPEDRERVRQSFGEMVRTGIGQRMEYRFLLADGSVRYIESQGNVTLRADGNVANVLVVSRDVTARRAAEQQLREQASLLDKARDAIIAMNLTHRVTYWNASAERLYGWTAAEAVGRDLFEIGLGAEERRLATAYEEAAAKGEWQGQLKLRSRADAKLEVATTWSLVRDAAGAPKTILMIGTDVTESKKLETQLLRAQRAESIGTLTGGIAHDLNNVLAPILMGAELLRLENLSESASRIVNTIETSAQHGAALVRQLLGFARGTDGERVQVRVDRLLHDLTVLLRQTMRSRATVNLRVAEGLRPIFADTTQIKQLLLNLCINARDAMAEGGTITLSADELTLDEDRARAMPEGHAGTFLCLRVSDTGTGIPPEILDRIFDPFFTTKEVGKGTGLGLSMVRGIVKGHQGFLHVESTVGVGTTFNIFLPIQEETGAAAPKAALYPGRGESILIIDNDEAVREMLAPFLQQNGYRVLAAVDGAGINWDQWREHPSGIGAVVMGLARTSSASPFAARLAPATQAARQKIGSAIPWVVCGDGPSELEALGLREPIHAAIAKPVDPALLLATLRKVLDLAAAPRA